MESFAIFGDKTSVGLFLATFTKFGVLLTPFSFSLLINWVGRNANRQKKKKKVENTYWLQHCFYNGESIIQALF